VLSSFRVIVCVDVFINQISLMSMLVTADFRDPLPKSGEGVGGDRDEPEGGTLNDLKPP